MENVTGYVKAFEAYLKSLNKSFYTIKQYTIDAKQFAEIIKEHTAATLHSYLFALL